eukprot:4070488-Pyramimonas_sp.AAC.1
MAAFRHPQRGWSPPRGGTNAEEPPSFEHGVEDAPKKPSRTSKKAPRDALSCRVGVRWHLMGTSQAVLSALANRSSSPLNRC